MPPFESLGQYRITKTLGRGGMGTVYAAVDSETGEPVAIKLIAQQLADDERFRSRFTAEIIALHKLQHPGIVRFLHSHRDEEGRVFYSMELVEGESLHARIRREKKLSWQAAIDIAIQICSALKHAHDTGVIHRDLKPANLMLTSDGTVKLVDFGIVKLFGDNQMTLAGSVLGTADYMAPEQALGGAITHRTDLYALGNVMYAMLTGRPPFTGKKVTGVIDSLKRDRPVPLDLVNPELPDALVELVHQLLEKDPARRPPTALVVMKRLQSMRAGLQREATMLTDGARTEVGDEVPSHYDDPDSQPTASTGSRGPTQVPRERAGHTPAANPDAATVVSRGSSRTRLPDGSRAPDDQPTKREAVTDFHLSDQTRSSGAAVGSADRGGGWIQTLSIAAMIAALALGGWLLVTSMKPPDADQLYVEVIQDGDVGAMKTFLRRFPEDPRCDEVRELLMQNRLDGVLKRLETQKKLDMAPLSAPQEGFLTAIEERESAPGKSAEKLQQWLDVYDRGAVKTNGDLAELVELARYQRRVLANREPIPSVDPRLQDLLEAIRVSVASGDAETIRKTLTGIIQIHADDPWAMPAIEMAKRQLNSLDEQTSP